MLSKIKNLYKNSFIYKAIEILINKKFRNKLTNHNFTILCPNCIGGVIYSRLGEKFNSPTINLAINTKDFGYFLENIDYYLSKSPIDNGFNKNGTPLGLIQGNSNDIHDIELVFTHYKTFEEGRDKWNERKSRINRDNTYVIMYDIDDLNEDCIENTGFACDDDLKRFDAFECKNKVLLTRNKDCKNKYAKYIEPQYNTAYPLVYLTRDFLGLNVFEKKWDYVEFLNGDNYEQ